MKSCSKCKIEKPVSEFYMDSRRNTPYVHCKACHGRMRNQRYKRDSQYRIRDQNKAKQWRKNNRHRCWAATTLATHRRKYRVFLSLEYLIDQAKLSNDCPFCGVELSWGKADEFFSPSLDRMNNEDYLSAGNTMIICRRCNVAKGTGKYADFLKWISGFKNSSYEKLLLK